jgi:hypothetical protein
VNEETLTIRLVFQGRELPNQDFVTPITATIRQLKQRINALFVSPSLITTTLLYVRPSGPTWTKFNRPGPINNDFLPGEFMIPCASLQQGTILRVGPYFLTYNEDNKKNDSDEEDNASDEKDEEYKEDPRYYNHNNHNKSDEETKIYQFYDQHGTSDSTSSDSNYSLKIHQRSYIRPEYGESSAESATRQEEIASQVRKRKQNVQELTLEDINSHGLYANPIKPLAPSKVDTILDTDMSVTQLPAEYANPWRNLRSTCLQLSGAFANDTVHSDLKIGEFHADLELDDGEKVRIMKPEAVWVPSTASTS